MIRKIFLTAALFASIGVQAQSYQERARQYVEQYQTWAQEEQRRSGVPAAITLGQGILETSAGESELATKANNHFGIKCKKSWQGETFAHDDDAPQECFRKYPTAYDSYRDHSDYLKSSPRYASCFALNTADYQGWAKELRKCGYATNPRYSQQLIKIIEDFQLQEHTYAAMRPAEPGGALIASTAAPAATALMSEEGKEKNGSSDTPGQSPDQQTAYGELTKKNGVRGFYAQKGDVLLEFAIRYKIRYARLLELNALPDAPLGKDQFVAIESSNRFVQILSHDGSQPAPAPTAEKTFVTASHDSTPAPEILAAAPTTATAASSNPATVAAKKPPVTETKQPVVATKPPVAATKPPVAASNSTATTPKPQPTVAPVASTPAVTNNPTPVSKPAPAPPQQTTVAAAPAPKPFNIADEVAVDDRRARYIPPSERNYPPTTSLPRTTGSPSATNSTASVAATSTQPVAPAPAPVQTPVAPAQAQKIDKDDAAEVTKSASSKNKQDDEDEDDEEPAANQAAKTNSTNSEFDKMKARFDQVVYAPSKSKTASAAPTASTDSAPTTQPVANAAKPAVSAAPATNGTTSGAQYHTVKSGETAYGIAHKYGISMKELMNMNNLNFEAIRVGQKLRVK